MTALRNGGYMKKVLLFFVLAGICGLTPFLEAGSPQPEIEKFAFASLLEAGRPSSCSGGFSAEHPMSDSLQNEAYCGSCSVIRCQGAERWQMCWVEGIEGGWGYCDSGDPYQFCAESNQFACICKGNPYD
jgi:hypothetical protein